MGEQTKNLLIGIFVLVACVLVISIILFLKPHVGNGKKTYDVRFANINKISVGTRVTFAGRPVGEVVAIDVITDARKEPTDTMGDVYYYQLVLKVDSCVVIYNTDEIILQTSGLLGEKSVAIIPKAAPKGSVAKILDPKKPIYAESADPIEKAFKQFSALAGDIDKTFISLNDWLDNNKENLTTSIKSFGKAMGEIEKVAATINHEEIFLLVKESIHHFTLTMRNMNEGLDELKRQNVYENVGNLVNNFNHASQTVDEITQDLANGKGTLGKLLKRDDFYLRLTSLMSKADTMMNDINHYGVLFQNNKGWQKMRTKRANLFNALDTPASFKDYFESEVGEINTAMGRLSMLVDKAQECPQRTEIFQSEPFKKDFADLLREVDDLADNLRLYNQQLQDIQYQQNN